MSTTDAEQLASSPLAAARLSVCAALVTTLAVALRGVNIGAPARGAIGAAEAVILVCAAGSAMASVLAAKRAARAHEAAQREREREQERVAVIQRALVKAREEARDAEHAKAQFLAVVSHEIRTPMNAVLGMTGLLLDSPLDEEQHSHASLVRSSAEGLLTILNDILDFSKIEAGHVELERVEFDLLHVVTEGIRLFAEQARGRHIHLSARASEGVPTHVVGDPGRLRQVLLNLVSNAIKFTERGEVEVTLSVYRDDLLRVTVRDTGAGIPRESQARLFMPFSQSDQSPTRRFGGAGLGLAISHRLVSLMGGRIAMKSELGRGSMFEFTACLPAAPGAKHAPATPLSVQAPHTPLASLRRHSAVHAMRGAPCANDVVEASARPRVLVVDDNVVNQRVARALLGALGYDSDVAADGREALEMVRRIAYPVILMDVQMPVMDGLESARAIRALDGTRGHAPIVALTATASESDRRLCLEAGMDDYLAKPIARPALAAALARWCPLATPPARASHSH